jgi:hypothetical protein
MTDHINSTNKIICVKMDAKIVDDLNERSNSMYLSVSNYCQRVLQEWINSQEKLNLSED